MSETPEKNDEALSDKPLELDSVFDIDARRSPYKPRKVKFRGAEYVLGATALGVLQAITTDTGGGIDKKEDETPVQHAIRLMKVVPTMMRHLCPALPQDPPWSFDEELAMLGAVTEVLGRVGRLRFPTAEGE